MCCPCFHSRLLNNRRRWPLTAPCSDEERCGPAFLACAGANRRRAGIVSDIQRDDRELCQEASPHGGSSGGGGVAAGGAPELAPAPAPEPSSVPAP